jgi:YVTN family beta-propeller protein
VYTANGPSDDVAVVSASTGAVEKRIHVEGGPWGLTVAP